MTDSVTDRTINLNSINELKVSDVINKMQDNRGEFYSSSKVKINGESFSLSFTRVNNRQMAVSVKKDYSGIKGFFQKLVGYRSHIANALNTKLAEVIKSNKFALATSNLDNFRKIVHGSLAKGKKTIEITDYGKSNDRRVVAEFNLVKKVEQEFSQQGIKIRFNQIDTYNDLIGISPYNVNVAPEDKVGSAFNGNISKTLDKLKNGAMELQKDNNISKEQLKAWTEFLGQEQNIKKLDIVSKLNSYLHMDKDTVLEKNTGWKAEFKSDPQKALMNFVLKNLRGYMEGVPEEVKQQTYTDVKKYLDIMHNPDENIRQEELNKFFGNPKDWFTPEQQKNYNDQFAFLKKANPELSDKEIDDFLMSKDVFKLGGSQRYLNFNSVFISAFFRQTSKLGLEFFNQQKVPVMFQYTNNQNNYMSENDLHNIINENHNTDGGRDIDRDASFSTITNSELRHSRRIVSRFDNTFNIKYTHASDN